MARHDYAFPFRIDPSSRQGRRTSYERHVAEMVRQLLLTTPGERVNLPEFGCGLRAMVFAPNSDALAATTQMLVQRALNRWLSEHLIVRTVEIVPPSSTSAENELTIRVEYVLLATRTPQLVELRVA